jgi:hypothetical protein
LYRRKLNLDEEQTDEKNVFIDIGGTLHDGIDFAWMSYEW